jgi:hypothetical protein
MELAPTGLGHGVVTGAISGSRPSTRRFLLVVRALSERALHVDEEELVARADSLGHEHARC